MLCSTVLYCTLLYTSAHSLPLSYRLCASLEAGLGWPFDRTALHWSFAPLSRHLHTMRIPCSTILDIHYCTLPTIPPVGFGPHPGVATDFCVFSPVLSAQCSVLSAQRAML